MRTCVFALVALICASSVEARPISIAVDVSGSMKSYGQWQRDALDAISALLSGREPSGNWRVTGSPDAAGEFTKRDADTLRILSFGDLQNHDYPFFRSATLLGGIQDLQARFPVAEAAYAEGRTNKTLAEAVAVTDSPAGSSPLLIMVSDFLVDAQLTPSQIAFLNDAQSRYAVHVLSILSWSVNPNVQIKLIKYVPQAHATEKPQPTQSPILRVQAGFHEPSKSVRISWAVDGAKAQKYSVAIRKATSASIAFSKDNLAIRSAVWPSPDGGSYVWTVIAYLEGGSQVVQRGTIEVPGSTGVGAVALIVGLLIAVAGALWWMDKSGMLPKGLRRRRRDENKEAGR